METQPLATELIKETQERLINVVAEIDCLDLDCDKALFVIIEMLESIDARPVKTKEDVYYLQSSIKRIENLAGIAHDYISKIQSCISEIVIRERNANK